MLDKSEVISEGSCPVCSCGLCTVWMSLVVSVKWHRNKFLEYYYRFGQSPIRKMDGPCGP
jgi:hypothetical protein